MKPQKLVIILSLVAFSFSARADWLVRTYRDGSAVNGLADADRLITNTAPIATGTIPQTDLLGFNSGEGTGHFSLNYPVPGIPQSQATDNYAVQVTGLLLVPASGNYTFALNTDDGGRLRIDGANIITDDVRSPPHDSPYVTVSLSAGSHAAELTWFNEAGGVNGGGAEGEAFWAAGTFSGFNSNFSLLTEDNSSLTLSEGLVAYYPFNGNANDASGNGNNGTLCNGATFSTGASGLAVAVTPGPINSSGSDYNSGPYVSLPMFNFAAMNNFTVALWVKEDSLSIPDGEGYVNFGDGIYGWLGIGRFGTYLGSHDAQLCFSVGSMLVSGPTPLVGDWSIADQGVFVHYALVYTNGTIYGYKNGVLQGSKAQSVNVYGSNAAMAKHWWDAGNSCSTRLTGSFDDLRIYNRALSVSEVQSLYTKAYLGPAPTPPTLVPTNRTPTSAELGIQTSGSFKVFTNGNFVSGVALDPSKLTIVLTHGWNDSSDTWPSNMASQFVAAGISANLVAWDWRDDANQTLPQWALVKTPSQGIALGTNLLQSLGAGYSQPIHFIGHSFGTCVNAAAANYLEANNYPSAKIQMTLLDEAEIGNDLRIVSPTTWNFGWIKPLPNSFAWSDNYVSLAGELQNNPNNVNVILTEGQPGAFYVSADDLWNDMKADHGVPCQWYGQTIADPAGSVMGDIWSFERNSTFTSPAGGTYFEQQGSGLVLNQISRADADALRYLDSIAFARDLGEFGTLKVVNTAVQVVGDVTANVIETALTDPNPVFQTTPATIGISTYAPATPDYWSPQLILQNHPLKLGPNGKPSNGHPFDGPSPTPSNSPAYAWLPMTIPTNATSLSFDFMLQGDGAGDSFAVALNGTNVFSLATSLIQTNVTMNSGLIDVSSYAGQNAELFLGIVGGASTNTILTVSGIRLYSVMPPLLQAQMSGNNFVLTWPLSAAGYVLQTSTNLTDTNSWTAIPNVPAIVNLQNTVTNPISGGAQFYRLKK
jgi:pimeloyl-ACP methyl ester carboxylesterase